MSDHDCGHVCCDERTYPYHDHFLDAAVCGRCQKIDEWIEARDADLAQAAAEAADQAR